MSRKTNMDRNSLHGPLSDVVIKERLKLSRESLKLSQGWLGYPSSQPSRQSINAFKRLVDTNANNIGMHTSSVSEKGFSATQLLEREVVRFVANLFKADHKKIDGYISTGGTESNITALWMLRNHLRKEGTSPCVLYCASAHYSIDKAIDILNISHNVKVATDHNFELDIRDLEKNIREQHVVGIDAFVIVATIGATLTGAIDRIDLINNLAESLKEELSVEILIHIDAAHGGFIHPFIAKEVYGFNYSCVATLSVDAHKLGLIPYSSGIFICRKSLVNDIRTKAIYMNKGYDDTLVGSRSGAVAAAAWAGIMSIGASGYKSMYTKCLNKRDYLMKRLDQSSLSFWYYTNPQMNILALESLSFPSGRIPAELEERYKLNLASMSGHNLYKIIIMPHVTRRTIDDFVGAMEKAYDRV